MAIFLCVLCFCRELFKPPKNCIALIIHYRQLENTFGINLSRERWNANLIKQEFLRTLITNQ